MLFNIQAHQLLQPMKGKRKLDVASLYQYRVFYEHPAVQVLAVTMLHVERLSLQLCKMKL